MNWCLQDRTLLLLHEEGGTTEERAHVEKCASCKARYQRLMRDLQVLGQVLREVPPVQTVSQPRLGRAVPIRWVPAAAALAATLAIVWSIQWVRKPSPTVSSTSLRDEEVARVLEEEVVLALFSTTGIGIKEPPKRATSLAYLQAALDGGWPCEEEKETRTTGCASDPFALFLERQGR